MTAAQPVKDCAPPDYDAYQTEADEFGQYLVRVYRRNGPVVRTVAWRATPLDTYGPEHILFAAQIGVGA